MKLKQVRRLVADLFPKECEPVFDRCYTTKEISLVASAFQIAAGTIAKFTREKAVAEAQFQAALDSLEARILSLETQLDAVKFSQVRPPEEVVETVVLTGFTLPENGVARSKIELIKVLREATGMTLMGAKAIVEDVVDHGYHREVFKGSQAKAAVAARILAGYGGVTERKEAI